MENLPPSSLEKARDAAGKVSVSPDDPIAYVLSLNLHRRHLSTTQRSMVAARARKMYDQQAKERLKTKGGHCGPVNLPEAKSDARDAAGKVLGVSGKTVDYASGVLRGPSEMHASCRIPNTAVSGPHSARPRCMIYQHLTLPPGRESHSARTRELQRGVNGQIPKIWDFVALRSPREMRAVR